MQQLTTVLLQLLVVAISGLLASVFRTPLPLLQIALGAALSLITGSDAVPDPTVFLLLFVAPLLYLDAFHFPQAEFFRLRGPIIAAAVGLVLFTVVGTGYLIHWLIPSLPLAISFAIASVLSPTDAVAVAGSLGSVRLPGWLMHILEGEALLNDASGLVCLRFAIAAAVSGGFSLREASGTFVLVALGGILVGLAMVFCLAPAGQWLERRLGSQSAPLILIHLLMPFAVYLAAEHLQVSGILAAVSAGFGLRRFSKDKSGVEIRLRGESVTDALQFTFNGLVFVLLGLQLPSIARGIPLVVRQQGFESIWTVVGLVLEITAALMFLRFLWTLAASYIPHDGLKEHSIIRQMHRARIRTVAGVTLAGARGAVTLAAVLSFPLALGGTEFAGRELAIILCAGIILVWLVVASAVLPRLVSGINANSETRVAAQERKARNRMIQAAIQRLDGVQTASDTVMAGAAGRLSDDYRRRLRSEEDPLQEDLEASHLLAIARDLHLEAIRAERQELRLMAAVGELEHHSVARLLRALDTAEAAILTA